MPPGRAGEPTAHATGAVGTPVAEPRVLPPRPDLGELGVPLALEAPALVVGQVQVQDVELERGQHVEDVSPEEMAKRSAVVAASFGLASALSVVVLGDETSLTSVVTNLVTNGIQHVGLAFARPTVGDRALPVAGVLEDVGDGALQLDREGLRGIVRARAGDDGLEGSLPLADIDIEKNKSYNDLMKLVDKIKVMGVRTNAETGEPVWRYVDKRTWWVYGGTPDQPEWNSIGEARLQGSKIEFKDSNNAWVDYDRLYKDLDVKNEEEWKMKVGDTKIKVEKDGDMKVKSPDGKYKVDEDGSKIKTDDRKIKTDDDGTKIKDDNK